MAAAKFQAHRFTEAMIPRPNPPQTAEPQPTSALRPVPVAGIVPHSYRQARREAPGLIRVAREEQLALEQGSLRSRHNVCETDCDSLAMRREGILWLDGRRRMLEALAIQKRLGGSFFEAIGLHT